MNAIIGIVELVLMWYGFWFLWEMVDRVVGYIADKAKDPTHDNAGIITT